MGETSGGTMSLKFGTSGLRGLVTDLTDEVSARYAAAFVDHLGHSGKVLIGRDLRESSPRIAAAVAGGLRMAGAQPIDCGPLPTPALALEGSRLGLPAIMVTGSHIPADRNGIKFYDANGEIGKDDEPGILAAFAARRVGETMPAADTERDPDVLERYRARYTTAFPGTPLGGMSIAVYQHSSVARDVMVSILEDLGASVTSLARSERFVPVDTEAIDPDAARQLVDWAKGHDAVVSTDGDADRPMVADSAGQIIPGDILGPLTARGLSARHIVTPVSSNTLVDLMPEFETVTRTRIGSPYVVAAMEAATHESVVGYEANGGFLLGFNVPGGLGALMTRDCMLPILVPLIECATRRLSLKELVGELPTRRTHADRIQGVSPQTSAELIRTLSASRAARDELFPAVGDEVRLDQTDGLRMTFHSGEIIHLRPSGNAPEFRCYAEADDWTRASSLVRETLERIKAMTQSGK